MQYLDAISKTTEWSLFPRQTIQYYGNPSLCPTSNTEEAEVEQFYEDLQDFLEVTLKKDILFIIGDWNAKVGSQETPGVTGKFGLDPQLNQKDGMNTMVSLTSAFSKHHGSTNQY